jgi:hypothetical protein
LTKLASLLVKTLAKPLSKRIKHEFSRYRATKQMLVGIGQTSHTITSRMQIWSAGYKVRSIKPLEEEQALKNGAEFVGEGFIFMVSGGLLVLEYNRTQESARSKLETQKEKIKAENASLNAKLHALDLRLKAVEDVVKVNSKSILGLGGTKYVQPSETELVPIVPDDSEDIEKIPSETAATAKELPLLEEKSSPSQKPWWKIW